MNCHLLLNEKAITEVKLSLGTMNVYHMTKAAAIGAMDFNPLWKVPSTLTEALGPFPVVLDDLGDPGDYLPLFIDGVRQDAVLEFYWDTSLTATPAAFQILAIGLERGVQSNAPIAKGKA